MVFDHDQEVFAVRWYVPTVRCLPRTKISVIFCDTPASEQLSKILYLLECYFVEFTGFHLESVPPNKDEHDRTLDLNNMFDL